MLFAEKWSQLPNLTLTNLTSHRQIGQYDQANWSNFSERVSFEGGFLRAESFPDLAKDWGNVRHLGDFFLRAIFEKYNFGYSNKSVLIRKRFNKICWAKLGPLKNRVVTLKLFREYFFANWDQ
jgi:hypothetical protein